MQGTGWVWQVSEELNTILHTTNSHPKNTPTPFVKTHAMKHSCIQVPAVFEYDHLKYVHSIGWLFCTMPLLF